MLNVTERAGRVRGIAIALLCVAAFGIGLAPKAGADEWDKKTIVTFSAPVEIPGGKVLPAGTYVFKLLDSLSNRNIVQIFDKDEKQVLATILAIPNYRLQPTDKPVLYFEERPAGEPAAVKAFFYAGDQYGQQFVYPHDRAAQLAKQNNQNVLAMSNDMSRNIAAPARDAKAQSVQELEKTEVTGVSPSGQEVEMHVIVLSKPESSRR